MSLISEALKKSTKQAAADHVQVQAPVKAETGFIIPDDILEILEATHKNVQPVMLVGPPGTGKTETCMHFAQLKGVPFMRVPIEARTEADVLSYTRQVQYVDGQPSIGYDISPFLEFIQHPGKVLIDEPFQSQAGDTLAPLRTILDEGKIYIPDGRVIIKHPECQIMFADNTKGAGENYEKYQRNIQDASLINRIEVCIEFDYLPVDKEVALTMGICNMKQADAIKLVKLANLTRAAYRKGELSRVFTLRQTKAIGKLGIPAQQAINYVFRNTLSSDSELQAFDGFVKTVY